MRKENQKISFFIPQRKNQAAVTQDKGGLGFHPPSSSQTAAVLFREEK